MAKDHRRLNLEGALIALATMALYALHDVFIKLLGRDYSPVQILFFVVLFSFPLVTIVMLHDSTAANLRPRHPWWTGLRTFCTVVVGLSAFYAFSVLPLTETYAIIFIAPLLITVLSIPVLGERVGPRRWAAVVVGLLGVLIVLQPGRSDLGPGHIAALAAAAFSALAAVIVRRVGRDERSVVLMLYPMVANFILIGALLPFVYRPMPVLHLGYIAAMAVLGVTAGLLFITAYRRAEAVVVAPMQYSQLLWAALYGAVIFDEPIRGNVILGASVIVASGVYILLREAGGVASRTTPVLSTGDLARDQGTVPRASLWARLRSSAR